MGRSNRKLDFEMKCLFIDVPNFTKKLEEHEREYFNKMCDGKRWAQIKEDHEMYPWLLLRTNIQPMEVNNGN